MTFDQVQRALAQGADPDMLCMTCPWDRFCITPPTMTRAEIDAEIAEASRKDEARPSQPGSFPTATILTALVMGARDTMAPICPVLAMQLRLTEGRAVVDLIKSHMQHGRSPGDTPHRVE